MQVIPKGNGPLTLCSVRKVAKKIRGHCIVYYKMRKGKENTTPHTRRNAIAIVESSGIREASPSACRITLELKISLLLPQKS